MGSKIRLVVLGLFLAAFLAVELVALLTPTLSCEAQHLVQAALAGRLRFLLVGLLLVALADVGSSWRARQGLSDPTWLEARLGKLRGKQPKT